MIDYELQEFAGEIEWQMVLSAYQAEELAAKEQNPEHEGWLPRIMSVEDVCDEHLPRIHGKLIALGFLKFQLVGRTAGVTYQLTPFAVKALEKTLTRPDDDSESCELAQSA